jgi:hypothetical protein
VRNVLLVAVLLLVAVGGGWLWGASGRWSVERTTQAQQVRQNLVEGRSALLDARLALYSVNFGEASQHMEQARTLLRRGSDGLKGLGRDAENKQVATALAIIDDAQRLSGKLDQNANSRTGEASKIIADVLDAMAKR